MQPKSISIVVILIAVAVATFVLGSAGNRTSSTRHASGAGTTTVPTTSVPTTSVPTPGPGPAPGPAPATAAVAVPVDGEWAVIAVDPEHQTLTLESDRTDVHYAMCAGSAGDADLATLQAGDFATVETNPTQDCLSQVSVLPAAAPAECNSATTGAYSSDLWVGYNASAHSVLYQTTGPSRVTLASRWCQAPTVLTAGGAPMALSAIPAGATVRLISSEAEWVREVIVQHSVGASHS